MPFQCCRSCDLTGNQLTGSLPSIWPLQLQLLQLVQNNLSGTLPSTGWPVQLQVLDAQLNRLTGSIPPELGSLSQLQQLRLPDNNLTGSLPAAWGGPDAFPGGLLVLQVSGNPLTGTLPGNWAKRQSVPGDTVSGASRHSHGW